MLLAITVGIQEAFDMKSFGSRAEFTNTKLLFFFSSLLSITLSFFFFASRWNVHSLGQKKPSTAIRIPSY